MSFRIEINPELKMKSDIMFKAFYGRKENEEFLQDFLEAVLEEKIKRAKIWNTRLRRRTRRWRIYKCRNTNKKL